MTDDSRLNPPKELYDKFDEFLGLLIELNEIRDTLYDPINQRIAATLDMMREEGGFRINTIKGLVLMEVRFDKDDDFKILERAVGSQLFTDPTEGWEATIKQIAGFCEELKATKEPEPEVLIFTVNTGRGDRRYTYKISREWINWFRKVLPHYPPEAPLEMAGHRAAKKHFQTNPLDRIERVYSPTAMQERDGDVEIEFYRVTREKL